MAFIEGQGIFGKVAFVDGTEPSYDRPYLIVGVYEEYIEVLNVSSIRGKEKKLAFPTNERLRVFRPPFIKPSFVKLDSLTKVPKSDWPKLTLLDNGNTLDATELNRIKAKL
jgi:hypothetical protein